MKLDGGELIRLCRKQAGLSQRELAQKVGITTTSLWRYETGRDMPRWDKVVWCLSVCGYTFEIKEIQDDQSVDNNSDTDRLARLRSTRSKFNSRQGRTRSV